MKGKESIRVGINDLANLGRIDGMALRIPVPDGSVTDLVAPCKKK